MGGGTPAWFSLSLLDFDVISLFLKDKHACCGASEMATAPRDVLSNMSWPPSAFFCVCCNL